MLKKLIRGTEALLMSIHNMFSLKYIATDKKGYPHNIFSYFSTKTYVVGTH